MLIRPVAAKFQRHPKCSSTRPNIGIPIADENFAAESNIAVARLRGFQHLSVYERVLPGCNAQSVTAQNRIGVEINRRFLCRNVSNTGSVDGYGIERTCRRIIVLKIYFTAVDILLGKCRYRDKS